MKDKMLKKKDLVIAIIIANITIVGKLCLAIGNICDILKESTILIICIVVNIVILLNYVVVNTRINESINKNINKKKKRKEIKGWIDSFYMTPFLTIVYTFIISLPPKETIFTLILIFEIVFISKISYRRWEQYIDNDNVNDKEK